MTEPLPESAAPSASESRSSGWIAIVLGAVLVIGSVALANLSVADSYDSECDAITSSHAEWVTDSRCGIVNLGTLVLVLGLVAIGLLAVVVGMLSLSGRDALVRPFAIGIASVGLVTTLLLAIRVAILEDPVLREGWIAVRNITAVATVVVCIAAGCLFASARAGKHSA